MPFQGDITFPFKLFIPQKPHSDLIAEGQKPSSIRFVSVDIFCCCYFPQLHLPETCWHVCWAELRPTRRHTWLCMCVLVCEHWTNKAMASRWWPVWLRFSMQKVHAFRALVWADGVDGHLLSASNSRKSFSTATGRIWTTERFNEFETASLESIWRPSAHHCVSEAIIRNWLFETRSFVRSSN